ncbi:MAG: hypothetical protein VXW32_11820 [Myxococcota bacterium]|nr:hypothetical protein [Myxococcota bacterium]
MSSSQSPFSTPRSCPDCQVPLLPIQIVDMMGQHGVESGLTFLSKDSEAQVSIFKTDVANRKGKVHGYLCNKCERVLLYAQME